jgi:cation diffusion facilitator CzcD-associated flavoprotein CzcO
MPVRVRCLTPNSSLSLHDPVYANHLPFFPFPSNWPIFTPAGKLANFLESYVDVLEINTWCESELDPLRTTFDERAGQWNVTILRTMPDGSKQERQFKVSHVVLATGLGGGKPKMPAPFPGQDTWDGKVVHSSGHGSGAQWKGKKALVVGACTSGHDVSQCTDWVWGLPQRIWLTLKDLRRLCQEWRGRDHAPTLAYLCHVRLQGHAHDG